MTREMLPPRRTSGVIDFRWGSLSAVLTVGYSLYPDGERCAEIFLNATPSLGDIEKSIRDAAIVASMALQHGATLDALIASVTHEEDGGASSLVGNALILVQHDIIMQRRGTDPEPEPDTPIPGPAPLLLPICATCRVRHAFAESCTSAAAAQKLVGSDGRYWPAHVAESIAPEAS